MTSTATTDPPAGASPDATAPAGAAPDATADRRRWLALAVVMTASFMDLVDVTIVNIAMPSIQKDIGASFSILQWITEGYALAFAAGLITGGRLGDIYGRRRVFLLGMGGFTLASMLCGVAGDPHLLVAARVLQGATAALMVPQVLAIVHATFPAHERGKVFGMFGAVVGLGAVSGPILGALLTQWNLFGLEWRPIFLVNLPVGIAGLIMGRRYISESRAPQALKLDLVGVVLATGGLLMLLYPLTQGRELGWPLWGFLCMAGSAVVFVLFVLYERHKSRKDGSPLVELSLFKVKSFAAGIGVEVAFGVACGVFFLIWTLYMQIGLGWSPLRAGLTGIPFSIAVSVAAGLSVQKLVPRFGRKVLQAGALSMMAGVLLYIWEAEHFGTGIHPWQMALPLTVMGLGMGLIVAPLTETVIAGVPREHSGSASGLINTTQQLGNAVGLGLVSVVFFNALDEGEVARGRAGEAFGAAFRHGMWWVAAVLGVVLALMFALPRKAVAPAGGSALPAQGGEAVASHKERAAV